MAKNKLNKKCIICGTAYSYCPACGADRKKPSWYMIFDGDNCNNIYDVVTGYRDARYTIKEANEMLKKCDLSKLDNDEFNEATRRQIKEILGINEISNDAVSELIEDVVEKETPIVDEKIEKESDMVETPQKQNNYNGNKYHGNNMHFNKKNK